MTNFQLKKKRIEIIGRQLNKQIHTVESRDKAGYLRLKDVLNAIFVE